MSVVPRRRAGWWHDYVCPTHGMELEPADGDVYPCPRGCRLRGERLDAAWTVYIHQGLARQVRVLAHRYADSGDEADSTACRDILAEYADYYIEIAGCGWNEGSESWMLQGKLFSQALSEAQWAVGIADAVITLTAADIALPESVDTMLTGLIETMERARHILVVDRDDLRNNYTAWLDAATRLLHLARVATGRLERDDSLLERVYDHMRVAVLDDGWEWEGSTYYHVFVLRAYLLSLRGVDPQALPADVVQRLTAMLSVLRDLAAPDGRLPILHDGPYDRVAMHREVLEICVFARHLGRGGGLELVEQWVRERIGDQHDGLEDLLDGWFAGTLAPVGPAEASRGTYFDDAGFVVLRDPDNRLTAVLDAGPHGGAHGHFDKLALYLYGRAGAWQPAPGVPPYASPLRHGYYARTIAHPTVRIDDVEQTEATATVTQWDAAAGRVSAVSADAFETCELQRTVWLDGELLVDRFRVTARDGAEHRITLGLRPSAPFQVTASETGWVSQWDGGDEQLVGLHVASPQAALALFPGRGPSDAPADLQAIADWTATAVEAEFTSLYYFGAGEPPVSAAFDESSPIPRLRIVFRDGSHRHIEVPH